MNAPLLTDNPDHWALFLDVDGTLIDFADHPDAVVVPPGLPDVLAELSELLGGALALVSGRSVAGLDRLFAPMRLSSAGLHGLERRIETAPVLSAADPSLIEPFRLPLARVAAAHPGAFVEDKGAALAVHFRLCDDQFGPARDARRAAEEIAAGNPALKILAGKSVVEVKPAAADKGDAVRWFMQHPPFAGRLPVFAGDDVTDEDAFAAIAHLNGVAIKVGAGDSTAPHRLGGVAETGDWLRDCARMWRERTY